MNRDHHLLIERLGHAGLIPFALLALLVWLVDAELRPWAAQAMAAYAALIASFLGGIHWGAIWGRNGVSEVSPIWWGITPSQARPALGGMSTPGQASRLGVMPPSAGLAWLGLVLVGCYVFDRKLYPALGLQHWLTLRFRLSSGAALSCWLAAGAL